MEHEKIVVGLLRTAIGRCPAEIKELEMLSGQDWKEVYNIASGQGVLALIWNRLQTLSA